MAGKVHRPDGWFLLEKNVHNGLDWGQSIMRALGDAIINGPTAFVTNLAGDRRGRGDHRVQPDAERMPACLHAYTLRDSPDRPRRGPLLPGPKPRFLLPAMLLGLPLAPPADPGANVGADPLIAMLAAASTWFGLYLMSVGWAP